MAHVCMYVGKGRVIKFVSFQLHVYKLISYMYLPCTKWCGFIMKKRSQNILCRND